MGDTWYLDEPFVTIQGQRQYLWRAVDQDGDVIDIWLQSRRDRRAAARFFRKLLTGISDLPALAGSFIHPKAAQCPKLLFVTASSRFRGRQLSPW